MSQVVGILGFLASELLTLRGSQGCAHEQTPAPPPAATFAVESAEVGDACSRVGGNCV